MEKIVRTIVAGFLFTSHSLMILIIFSFMRINFLLELSLPVHDSSYIISNSLINYVWAFILYAGSVAFISWLYLILQLLTSSDKKKNNNHRHNNV